METRGNLARFETPEFIGNIPDVVCESQAIERKAKSIWIIEVGIAFQSLGWPKHVGIEHVHLQAEDLKGQNLNRQRSER